MSLTLIYARVFERKKISNNRSLDIFILKKEHLKIFSSQLKVVSRKEKAVCRRLVELCSKLKRMLRLRKEPRKTLKLTSHMKSTWNTSQAHPIHLFGFFFLANLETNHVSELGLLKKATSFPSKDIATPKGFSWWNFQTFILRRHNILHKIVFSPLNFLKYDKQK